MILLASRYQCTNAGVQCPWHTGTHTQPHRVTWTAACPTHAHTGQHRLPWPQQSTVPQNVFQKAKNRFHDGNGLFLCMSLPSAGCLQVASKLAGVYVIMADPGRFLRNLETFRYRIPFPSVKSSPLYRTYFPAMSPTLSTTPAQSSSFKRNFA